VALECVRNSSLHPFNEELPVKAGVPLGTVTFDGRLTSPLHPATSPLFQYSRKRQAYGTVAPHSVPPIRHQPPKYHQEHVTEARRSWFKAYSKDCEQRALSSARERGLDRTFAGSGEAGHTEQSPTSWTWQSHRGWTNASRHNHENSQKQVWLDEARQRWRTQKEATWRSTALQDGGDPQKEPHPLHHHYSAHPVAPRSLCHAHIQPPEADGEAAKAWDNEVRQKWRLQEEVGWRSTAIKTPEP